MEFLRVAGGEAATPLAVLRGEDESLAPRARALVRLAVTLTAEPWALTQKAVDEVHRQGLDEEQVEAAVAVIAMFNYFTRVADATGIEFDYQTPLPAFEPDLRQVPVARPGRSVSSRGNAAGRRRPAHGQLAAAWESWRAYVLESGKPLGRPERRLLAAVAAEEAADWEVAESADRGWAGDAGRGQSEDAGRGQAEDAGRDGGNGPGGVEVVAGADEGLAGFARKLSREPWRMKASDLETLRGLGYSEEAVLHVISVVAHQNADSRLAAGLGCLGGR